MKKLKDLIYDYNDVFVALIIIAIAAIIIVWRVSTIIDYPTYIAEKTGEEQVDVDFTDVDLTIDDNVEDYNDNPEDFEADPDNSTQGPTISPEDTDPEGTVPEQDPQPAKDVTIEIPKGSSGAKIGTLLKEQGLIADSKDFTSKLTDEAARKLKAGTFTIPAGSTVDEIIKILTK